MTTLSSFASIQGLTEAPQTGTDAALPASLRDVQQQQRVALADLELPTRKTEHWKYSARRLKDLETLPAIAQADSSELKAHSFACPAIEIAIDNGLVGELPEAAEGLHCKRFADLTDAEIAQLEQGVIARADDLVFASLNKAAYQDGLFIVLDANARPQQPLRINISQSQKGIANQRIFVIQGDNSELTLIEDIQLLASANDQGALLNQITDVVLGAGAKMIYLRSDVCAADEGRVIAATGVRQGRDSRFESHCLGFGKHLDRHDLRVELAEAGAECNLNGVCLTQQDQHYDNHTCIEHLAPHCQSNENYRCIAGDRSQIVFNGRIHIHPDAQKTLGSMSNKNLLLSSGAEINAKPELEIYADDVKCAHGTTIGQLDEKEVYYLKTRGIEDEQARQMLTLGFVLEIVHENPVQEIAEYWEQLLAERLRFEQA